jgi:hypothetical protein
MARSTLFTFALLSLCLGAANLPAQESSMIPPPIPLVLPPEPPDPDTLPPPPQFEWAPLGSKGEDEGGGGVVAFVSPPLPEPSMAPPPPPMIETALAEMPDPAELDLAKPDVEIWREASDYPQIPARTSNRLAQTYVTGTEPVWLRVQFNPQAAGKSVYVKPGRGITLEPPAAIQTISSSGECLFLARIAEGISRSHIVFYCDSVKTVLPVMKAPLATVIGAEEATGGGL